MTVHSSMQASEFLTFRIDAVEYGIDLAGVREVRGRETIPVIGAQSTLRGTIDFRGVALPIIDLRALIDVGLHDLARADAVIVLGHTAPVVGIVVDSVRDVLTLDCDDVRPRAEATIPHDVACVHGLGVHDQRNVVLIDIECALARAGIALA